MYRDFDSISIREQLEAVNYDTSKFLEAMTLSGNDLSPEQLFKILSDCVDNLSRASVEIEEEVQTCQTECQNLEFDLYHDIEKQSKKLATIQKDVEAILKHFEEASSGAVRLGDRLNACESERKKLQFAQDLAQYVQHFEHAQPLPAGCGEDEEGEQELLQCLPQSLRDKNWGEISHILYYLRRILYEISSEEVHNAEVNIRNLSEAVELVLLSQFEEAILVLIEDPSHVPQIKHAQSLAQWLHLFGSGSTLQRRFIFSVVERRVPVAKFFRRPSTHHVLAPEQKKAAGFFSKTQPKAQHHVSESTVTLVDHLSQLFMAISDLCQEQFSIIRLVFPSQSVEKVTKMLITRIFNDPAFGIQARVDNVLRPKPPAENLTLPEYLDALVTVREKLSALHLMLLEYCTGSDNVDYADIDAELEATSQHTMRANKGHQHTPPNMALSAAAAGGFVTTSQKILEKQLEREVLEKRQKTEELQAFLEDQVAQVFQVYLHDYFEKELLLMKHDLLLLFTQAVGDARLLSKGAEGSLPKLRFEKIGSVQQLVLIVTRNQFIKTIFNQGADTIDRMVNVGRDDEKKLPLFIKDVFLTESMFVTDCVFVPWARSIRALVEKHSTSRQQTSQLLPPPPEFLTALSCLHLGAKKFRHHFDEVFSKPLSVQPNALTVCQESRRQALKTIDKFLKEAAQAWLAAVVFHCRKVLEANTKKLDFCPRRDSSAACGLAPTPACSKVCEHLLEIVRSVQDLMTGVNLADMFWKPLGRQIAAVLISLIKRHKVSDEGSFVLVRDMDEYHKVFLAADCAEAIDLISCLREIMYIYMTPADNVVKMVSDDLRHLNTQIVLALVRSRVDYTQKAGYDVALNDIFAAFKGESLLPWEVKNSSNIGPVSLRKVAVTHKGATAILNKATYDASLKSRQSGAATRKFAPATTSNHLDLSTLKSKSSPAPEDQQQGLDCSPPPVSAQTRRPAPKTSSSMSPSTASAKSTMFNKVSSVFKFKS